MFYNIGGRDNRIARIIKNIEIEDQPAEALFDTGAIYTYVRSLFVQEAPRRAMIPSVHIALGGRDIEIRELCFVQGKIEGLDFVSEAAPLDEVGYADGHGLDVLIGAHTMEQWEIRLDPRTERWIGRGCGGVSSPNSELHILFEAMNMKM